MRLIARSIGHALFLLRETEPVLWLLDRLEWLRSWHWRSQLSGTDELTASLLDVDVSGAAALVSETSLAQLIDWDSVPRWLVHEVRQERHRRMEVDIELPCPLEAIRQALLKDGLVPWRPLGHQELVALRRGVEEFIDWVDRSEVTVAPTYLDRCYRMPENGYTCNDFLAYAPEMLTIIDDGGLLDLATAYLGRPPQVQRINAMRYHPGRNTNTTQFRWHHDLAERRLKLFILLTDVGPNDQAMRFIEGSHAIKHSLKRYRTNRVSPRYCGRRLDLVNERLLTGKAGDTFLFDSNGVHIATRSPSAAIRDVAVVEWTPSRWWVIGTDSELLADMGALGSSTQQSLRAFADAVPPWDSGSQGQKGWLASLSDPDIW